MDATTKQRLIGAIVLVLAMLWVVPVFLDGPSDLDETISEKIDLPGATAQLNQTRTIELDVPVRRSPAESAGPSGGAAQAPPTRAPSEPSPRPAPTESASRDAAGASAELTEPPVLNGSDGSVPVTGAAPSDSGLWAVQIGSFAAQDNAEKLAARLRGQGFAAFVSQHRSAGEAMHRVRIGPLSTRESAEVEAQKLAARELSGQVVTHP